MNKNSEARVSDLKFGVTALIACADEAEYRRSFTGPLLDCGETYDGIEHGGWSEVSVGGEDDVERVDHPRRPGDGEGRDDEQERDGDATLLAADARPLGGRVEPHAGAVTANHGQRQRVGDADDDDRDEVAGGDDGEEVREGGRVARVARPALRRRRLVDHVRQRADRRRPGRSRPQPRT